MTYYMDPVTELGYLCLTGEDPFLAAARLLGISEKQTEAILANGDLT